MASRSTSTARVADLERRLAEAEAARAAAETARIEAETRLAAVEEARARPERLLSQMRRDAFGAKSEKGDPDQHHLPFEDVEAAAGMLAAASEAAEKVIGPKKAQAALPQRNKGNLPAHLPRIEQAIPSEICDEMVERIARLYAKLEPRDHRLGGRNHRARLRQFGLGGRQLGTQFLEV